MKWREGEREGEISELKPNRCASCVISGVW